MMAIDMTAQLAPLAWGFFGLLLVSGAGIIAAAWPRHSTRDTARRAGAEKVRLVARPATT